MGPGVYTAVPREGEFTPSTRDCCARSNHCWERVRFRVGLVCAIGLNLLAHDIRIGNGRLHRKHGVSTKHGASARTIDFPVVLKIAITRSNGSPEGRCGFLLALA